MREGAVAAHGGAGGERREGCLRGGREIDTVGELPLQRLQLHPLRADAEHLVADHGEVRIVAEAQAERVRHGGSVVHARGGHVCFILDHFSHAQLPRPQLPRPLISLASGRDGRLLYVRKNDRSAATADEAPLAPSLPRRGRVASAASRVGLFIRQASTCASAVSGGGSGLPTANFSAAAISALTFLSRATISSRVTSPARS